MSRLGTTSTLILGSSDWTSVSRDVEGTLWSGVSSGLLEVRESCVDRVDQVGSEDVPVGRHTILKGTWDIKPDTRVDVVYRRR